LAGIFHADGECEMVAVMKFTPDHTPDDLGARLRRIMMSDAWSMETLKIVRELALPDWAIGAGFVRSLVWDQLAGNTSRTPLPDIDVLYFDANDPAPGPERDLEALLREIRDGLPWSVHNQARMHLRNGDAPYRDTDDAIAHWLETPTALAVRLEADDGLTVLAPLGLDDLFGLTVSPTDAGVRNIDQYRARIKSKGWADRWPGLQIHGLG